MKKKIEQNLKKCCSLVLAMLLMFNTSSLQAFADVQAVNNNTEIVVEQTAGVSDTESNETTETVETETLVTEEPEITVTETVTTEISATEVAPTETTETAEVITTEETNGTEEVIATEAGEVAATEEANATETTEEVVATEETETTEEPETTEEVMVTEEPETTEEVMVTEEPETTEESAVTEEPETTEEVITTEETNPMQPLCSDEITTTLKIVDITGNIEQKKILMDADANPFLLETTATIKMEVSIADESGKEVAYAELTNEQKAIVEEAISNYLTNINVAVTISNGTNEIPLVDASRGNDLASVFKNQYIPVDGTEDEIAAKEKAAAEKLNAAIETLANDKTYEMSLTGEMTVCAGNYDFKCQLTNPKNVTGISLKKAEGKATLNVTKLVQVIAVTPETQSETVDIKDSVTYSVTSSENLSGRQLQCVVKNANGTVVDKSIVDVAIDNDTKSAVVTPLVSGKYTLEIGFEETAVYSPFSTTKTLTARKPEWNFTVKKENNEPLTAKQAANYIVSVEGLNLNNETLSCTVYEKKDGKYVKREEELARVIGDTESGAKRVQFTPDKAVEYKIEYKLAENNSYRETIKSEVVTPAKINRSVSVDRQATGITKIETNETFVVVESGRDLDEDDIVCTAYKMEEDGSKVALGKSEVEVAVQEGQSGFIGLWDESDILYVNVEPKVIGTIQIDFKVIGDTELYQDTTVQQTLTVKKDWPVSVIRSSSQNGDTDNAAAPITYSIVMDENIERNYELECKAYYEEKIDWRRRQWVVCPDNAVSFVESEDKTTITVTPKMSGKLKFDFIFKDGENATYYYQTVKTTDAINVERIASVSTVSKGNDDAVPALEEVTYSVVDNGAVVTQEITSYSVKIDGRNATNEEIEHQMVDARTVKLVPKVSGVFELEFTLGQNAVYHQAVISRELTVNKIKQPEEIAVTLETVLEENETITSEKQLIYAIKDTATEACDISMRNIIWRITDKDDKVVFTNVATADGDTSKFNPEAFVIEEVDSEDKTVRKVSVTPQVSGDYTIEFELAEDATYLPVSETTDISVKPSDLTGFASASGDYVKTNPLVVSMTLNGGNSELFAERYDDITVTFYATYLDGEETKEIELTASADENAKNGWEIDTENGSNAATFVRTVDDSVTRNFDPEKEYNIVARFELPENFAFQVVDNAGAVVNEFVYENFKAANGDLLVTLSDSNGTLGTTYSLEYTETEDYYETIYIFAEEDKEKPDGKNLIDGLNVGYEIKGEYDESLEIVQNTSSIRVRALKPIIMETKIAIVIDDVCEENCGECGIYNGKTVELTINVTSPKSTDPVYNYAGNSYDTVDKLHDKAAESLRRTNTPEYWYSQAVTVAPVNDFYNYVAYIEMDETLTNEEFDAATGWNFVPTSWTINKEELTNYAFYFFHVPADGSIEGKTSNQIREEFLNTRQADNGYKILESIGIDTTAPSSQPGGEVTFKFTDNVDRTTTVSYRGSYLNGTKPEYEKESPAKTTLCVDTVKPKVEIAKITVGSEEKEYKGEWTNETITYILKTIKKADQVSGINNYQYAFVSRADEAGLANAEWKTIEKNKKSGRYEIDIVKLLETEKKDGVRFNGYLYVRAESNAGLMSTNKSIEKNKEEARIWQEELAAPKVSLTNEPAITGWYNKETGEVEVSFAYPEYNKKSYAPPVGLEIKVSTTTTEEDGSNKTTEKEVKYFYKGIFDESAAKVIEGEATIDGDDIKVNTKKSLKEDGLITVNSDCKKKIEVTVMDKAGNKSETYKCTIKADFTAPDVEKVVFSTNGQSKEQTKLHTDTEKDVKYNLFSGSDVTVNAAVTYGISGESKITLKQCKNIGEWKEKGGNVVKSNTMTLQPNTRGFVYVTAKDKAGNVTTGWTDGFVADNQNPMGVDGMEITVVATGANEEQFFNKDVPVSISITDSKTGDDYSGLSRVTYTVGYEDVTTKEEEEIYHFKIENPTWKQIAESISLIDNKITIDAEENESNEAYITVDAIDKSGNESTVTMDYKIDVTVPIIDVTFDKAPGEHGEYFNESRTAIVEIVEKNFDPSRVQFNILKDGKEISALIPNASAWKESADGLVHTAAIAFADDGDYSFTVECTDLADNEAEAVEVEEFTIDKTAPEVTVTYDNEEPWKENFYNTVRTATVTITEHNFDEDKFIADITPAVAVGGFKSYEDTHTATIVFAEDEHYDFTLNCEDMAGNVMTEYEAEDFHIDTTAPEVSITGVEDLSANAGDIAPVVYASDKNFDAEGMSITLTNSKGSQITLEKVVSEEGEGTSYTLTNVNDQPDEIYTLTAEMTDMAGNVSNVSYRFSLNRNGSTYDLSDMTTLVENVYTKYAEMDDLQVLEMNVDAIEEFSVYVSKNGVLQTNSVEGNLPQTLEENTVYYRIDKEGNAETGYRYYYTLYKENFEAEGVYDIMFYSKDRAGNEVNNTLTDKGADITFVVDNSAPKVIIEGIESDAFYAEDSKDANVTVNDNFKLEEALLYLVDEDGKTVETYDYMELAKEAGEVVTISLPNNEKKMSLSYRAVDAAGNEVVSLSGDEDVPTGVTISTNLWLQFINNEVAVAVAVAVSGVAVAAPVGGSMLYRRRKKTGAKLWKRK